MKQLIPAEWCISAAIAVLAAGGRSGTGEARERIGYAITCRCTLSCDQRKLLLKSAAGALLPRARRTHGPRLGRSQNGHRVDPTVRTSSKLPRRAALAMMQDERIIRLKTVLARTGLSRSTVYRMVANGSFPRQRRIGIQATGWYQSEVEKWISDPLGYHASDAA